MTPPTLTVATEADRPQIMSTLVEAFRDDPIIRWLFPDDATYPTYAEAFFGPLFDKRVRRQAVWTIDGLSVAIWEPPGGVQDDGVQDGVLTDPMPPEVRARVEAYDHAVHGALPAQPYWYLGVLATHPDHAGKRWGREVMAEGLRRAAEDGVAAVLETSNPGNVALYERAGFAVVTHIAEPVPTWIMRHAPVRG